MQSSHQFLQSQNDKVQAARDIIRSNLQKFSSPPDPVKMPLASKQLVSFQNHQWIYDLLMAVWSAIMKTVMLRYQELHDQDGVVIWYCFQQHFAGTTVENLMEAGEGIVPPVNPGTNIIKLDNSWTCYSPQEVFDSIYENIESKMIWSISRNVQFYV